MIEIDDEEYERESDDPDIVSIGHRLYLHLQGFPDNMAEIKKELFGKEKIIV